MLTHNLLVNGYIRQIQETLHQIVPYPINELCLQFYHFSKIIVCKNSHINDLFIADFDLNLNEQSPAIITNQSWKCEVRNLQHPSTTFDSTNTHWQHIDMAFVYAPNVSYSSSITQSITDAYNSNTLNMHLPSSNSYPTIFKCGGRNIDYCCAMILHPMQFLRREMISFNMELPRYPKPINAAELIYSDKYGLLSIGGAAGNSVGLASVYALYLGKDINRKKLKWELVFNMRLGRIAPSAVMISDTKLVVMIGYGAPSYTDSVELYDLENNQRMELAHANKKRSDATALYDGNREKIYLSGGDTADSSMIVEEYDIHKNVWNMNNIPKLNSKYFTRPLLWMETMDVLAIACKRTISFIDLRMDNKKWIAIRLNHDSLVQTLCGAELNTSGNSWKYSM